MTRLLARTRVRPAETGVRSMRAFPLFVEDDTIGALVHYSRHPHAFDSRSRLIGSALAAHAAFALNAASDRHGSYTSSAR